MLPNNAVPGLAQPIIAIYNSMEMGLLESIAKRFDVYDTVGGSLEWQVKKLDELGALTAENIKIIAKMSQKSDTEIAKMLNDASMANIDLNFLKTAYSQGLIPVDPAAVMASETFRATIERSYIEVGQTFKLIQTKALEASKQAYMDVVNRAYIETGSGIYDYGTSIRNALRRMADQGITGATYKRGNKLVKYSIEGVVRRDTITAVNQLGNRCSEVMTNDIGAGYVEISTHIGARVSDTNHIANHAGWQGKVYKIEGSDEYQNLKEETGYPDDIQGLGGVNCRHRMFPFIPGISVPNKYKVDEDENRKVYEASQKQRAMERAIRATKKRMIVAKASGDTDEALKQREKLTSQQKQIEKLCRDNNLRRQTEREMVQEEY